MEAMHPDVESIVLSEEDLAEAVRRLGAEITRDYADKNPLLVAVLRGAVVFMADLMRAIECPVGIDFMAVSSYGNGVKSSGVVRIKKDLDTPIEGRHVLVVEDILDTGRTLSYLLCRPEGAAPSQIADDLMILRQSMTNILDGLESRGLVERLADPKDRRRLQVRLLDAGQELAAALLEEENAYSSRIYDYMGEDDLREYRRLERKMYEAKVAALRDLLEERNQ